MRTLSLTLLVAVLIISTSVVSATSDSAESDISVGVEDQEPDTNEKTREFEGKDDEEHNLISYGFILVLLYILLRTFFALKTNRNSTNS